MYEIVIAGILFLTLVGLLKIFELLIDVSKTFDTKIGRPKTSMLDLLTNERNAAIILIVLLIVCFWLGPYLVHRFDFLYYLGMKKEKWVKLEPNVIGDAFGGTIGPIVGFVGVVLTFFAFYVQYQANETQRKTWRIERFESKFYELLRIHKENVAEMNIGDKVKGRDCFIEMFLELRALYFFTTNHFNPDKDNLNILEFSYEMFFHGYRNFRRKALNEEKLSDLITHFQTYINANITSNEKKECYKNTDTITFCTISHYGNTDSSFKVKERLFFPFKNLPVLNGNYNRLEHYYRHLYLMVKYVDEKCEEQHKQEYFDLIRAQLSNYEQLLMYYNSLAWFQEEWKPYFVNYKLIKNLPVALADFDKNPEEYFQKELNEGILIFNDLKEEN